MFASLHGRLLAAAALQNWQTPKKIGACYEVITTTADGSRLSALFKLK
jgi:hypothetical protein